MTVARLRQSKDADGVDVTFLESARFYALRKGRHDFDRVLGRLRDALATGRRVRVTFAAPGSEEIADVEGAG